MLVTLCRGLVTLALALLATGVHATEADALKLLQRASPNFVWDPSSALKIDIDADGKPDYVFLSQDAKSATVGLVLGKAGRSVLVQTFPIGDPSQDSLCGTGRYCHGISRLRSDGCGWGDPRIEANREWGGVYPGWRRVRCIPFLLEHKDKQAGLVATVGFRSLNANVRFRPEADPSRNAP